LSICKIVSSQFLIEFSSGFQGYLWYKAVQTANKDAEEQDRRDGFL
jgi:hypothetical protein